MDEVPVERCSDLIRDLFKTLKIQMGAKYLMLLQKSRLAQLAACPDQQIFPKCYPQCAYVEVVEGRLRSQKWMNFRKTPKGGGVKGRLEF